MKKNIIIVGVIAVVLVAIILNHKNIYRFYKINQIKNDIIDTLNGKFNDRTHADTIKTYKRYHKSIEELNHYDITEMIDAYIEMLEESIKIYSLKKNGVEREYKEKHYELKQNKDLERGKDIKLEYYDMANYICYDITDKDLDNYNKGIFKEKLIEELKTCLDYEGKDGKIEWQINSIKDLKIELPYNCYIDYKAYHREDNKEFKKAVDVILDKNFELEKKENRAIVKYETYNGDIKEQNVTIYFINLNGKEYYDLPIYNLLTIHADTLAEAHLGSYTGDRIVDEKRHRENLEMWKIYDREDRLWAIEESSIMEEHNESLDKEGRLEEVVGEVVASVYRENKAKKEKEKESKVQQYNDLTDSKEIIEEEKESIVEPK